MTSEQLTAALAEKVMHWSVTPERYLLGNRQWIRRTQFQPLTRVQDAFRLLRKSASDLSLRMKADGSITATVRIGGRAAASRWSS